MHNNLLNKKIGYGSITDGTFKLEVHIVNFNNEDYDSLEIYKGDKVQLIGSIRNKGINIYITININISL